MSFESKLAAITVAFLIYGSSYRQQLVSRLGSPATGDDVLKKLHLILFECTVDLNVPVEFVRSVLCVVSRDKSSEKRQVDVGILEMSRTEKWKLEENSQSWGYFSPPFHYRALPIQLYKFKHSLGNLEKNTCAHCVLPGIRITQAILFKKPFNSKLLDDMDKGRKHNNTPIGNSAKLKRLSQLSGVNSPLLPNFSQAKEHNSRRDGGEKNFETKKSVPCVRLKCSLRVPQTKEFKTNFSHNRKLPCLGNQS